MSTYLPELILVTIEPKTKQLTNKLSEVTEFSTCNIQNQICKASCYTSKTIKRKKLWALLYEEIKPWQWNRAARENMITFRYWKGHLWAVFYAEKNASWGIEEKLPTPPTLYTIHLNGLSFWKRTSLQGWCFPFTYSKETREVADFPPCRSMGFNQYCVSQKFGQIGVSSWRFKAISLALHFVFYKSLTGTK